MAFQITAMGAEIHDKTEQGHFEICTFYPAAPGCNRLNSSIAAAMADAVHHADFCAESNLRNNRKGELTLPGAAE
jgi:hypothetical protein